MRPVLLSLLLLSGSAVAQTAVDLYHDAARLYIAGEKDAAEQAAVAGLNLDPEDPKLHALLERIRQQEERPEQEQQGGDGEGDRSSEREESAGEPPSSEPRDDDSGNSDPSEAAGPAGQSQQEDPGNPGTDAPGQSPPHEAPGEQSPTQPESASGEGTMPGAVELPETGTMTREEAERILNALSASEAELLRSIRPRPTGPRRVERDW